jgi:hypothetical protein
MYDIACPECNARLSECGSNEHGYRLPSEMFAVGLPARGSMGHAMFFTNDGRTALCSAKRLAAVSLGRRGGLAKSKAKAAASRENGRRNGRRLYLGQINAELERLRVGSEDLGPCDSIVASQQGDLYQLADDGANVSASARRILRRLRPLPDGAGYEATWAALADLA